MKNFCKKYEFNKISKRLMFGITTISLLIMILINNQFIVKATEQEINKGETTKESKINTSQEIEKYFALENGQTILQEKINIKIANLTNKEYEYIKEIVPKIQNQLPESIVVLLNEERIDENLYTYNPKEEKIEITLKKENNIVNWGNENDEYKIIYKYNNLDVDKKETIILNTEVRTKLEKEENEIRDVKSKEVELIKTGENISISGKMTKEIYKGYLYENGENETKFKEIYDIEISNAQEENEIIIKNEASYFINENEKIAKEINNNINFKNTKILKDNMLEILGNEGTVTIKNEKGDILSVINKDTTENEYGIIEVNYNENEVKNLEIVTTNPIKEGNLKIMNDRAILPNAEYSKEELREVYKIKQEISANESNYEMESNLLDTTLQADFNINKTELSTMMDNQELEIKTILKSNNNTMELYENPVIKITLPEEIEEIKLKEEAKILYNEEIKIKSINITGNDIIIQLDGSQTKYNKEAIEGIIIDLTLEVKVNKKATNATKNINMIIENNNKEIEINKEINFVSPKEIIALNNIQELGIETYGNEESAIVNLDRKAEQKEITISSQIINNTGKEIKNIKIIGEFPTNRQDISSTENNLNILLKSKIEINNENCKIYYTRNNNATEDLNNLDNQWEENVEDLKDIKKYMITLEQLAQSGNIQFNYKAIIPENLDYNQQAIEGYKVIYDKDETKLGNEIKSTYIEMTTGKGPIIDGKIVAFLGEKEINENSDIKAGEEIKYKISLRNIGTEDSGNVKLVLDVPEGMYYKEDREKRQVEIDLENIKTNENTNAEINLVVNEDLLEKKNIENKIKIKYKDIEKETNIIKYNIVTSEIVGKVEMITNNETTFFEGDIIEYRLTITNNSDKKLENIKVKWTLPQFCKIDSQAILGSDNFPQTNFEIGEEIKIDSLEAKQSIKISLHIELGEVIDEEENVSVGATIEQGENRYTIPSSEVMPVYGMNNFEISMKANNENGFINPGEEIIYTLMVTNKNKVKSSPIISDQIAGELYIEKIEINEEETEDVEIDEDNQVYIDTEFEAGETKTITITTSVNEKESVTEDEEITNKAILTTEKLKDIESNEIKHIIIRKNNEIPEEEEKYKINGIVWKDTNKNGLLENNEERLNNIKVFLINTKTNKIETDENGNEMITMTEDDGSYILSDIKKGEYLVAFKYDNTRYKITTYKKEGEDEALTSKVINKKLILEGTEDIFGITDSIKILDNNISNINMGLIETEKFDFKLDKYIKNVIVENNKGRKSYNYNNAQLTKIEIDKKELNNSKVTIEYNIVISNPGEVAGYIKNVVDYIPKGFKFNKTKNKGWYEKEGNLYNESLSNEKINSGEAKILTLTLEKEINKNDMGTYTNMAEIEESYNELGIQDINSKEGNKQVGENDTSTASIIISIRTGKAIFYITLLISCILIIGIGVFLIKRKVIDEK